MGTQFDPQWNINDLPSGLIKSLSRALGAEANRLSFLSSLPPALRLPSTAEYTTAVDFERLLVECGNLGLSARDLLNLLHQAKLEWPQIILRRRFSAVRITHQPSPKNVAVAPGETFKIVCKATGFPYPRYQWLQDDLPVAGAVGCELETKVFTSVYTTYSCLVYNEISELDDPTKFYRRAGKQFSSECLSSPVVVSVADGLNEMSVDHVCSVQRDDTHKCFDLEACQHLNLMSPDGLLCCCGREKVAAVIERPANPPEDKTEYKATDKVALIISNSAYENLPPLMTPVADAECLADGLLAQGFKTVTLGDLNLAEMRSAITEYCQLLGQGVYALFYFVGHGVEARGQCYLLPVDAPRSQYSCNECLCAEEVLSLMQESNPALNVILLDICRRFPPQDIDQFAVGGIQFKPRVNRNTVFGYATSFGEGAYEVLGEENGIFMKYLRKHLADVMPITDVLKFVLHELEEDPKAGQMQFPEVKTNLSRPRSLCDELVFSGHTKTFDIRTVRWQQLHEIPNPLTLAFAKWGVRVTVWFDFCGHFTNWLYCHVSLATNGVASDADGEDKLSTSSDFAVDLEFNSVVSATPQTGPSQKYLLKHLQRLKGPLTGRITLKDSNGHTLDTSDVQFGSLAISSFGIK